MSNEKRIDDIIKSFSDIGIQLQRVPKSFSFGTKDECRELFYSALVTVDKSIKEVVPIPEHESIIDWMTDTQGKGLFFAGVCGRGKTSILTGVVPLLFKMSFDKLLIPMQSRELADRKQLFCQWAYCIDDVGAESIKNDYGEKSEPFADIMNDAEQFLKPVFASTNLIGKEVIQRYGKRTMDRIIRLCKIVKFEGNSFRH